MYYGADQACSTHGRSKTLQAVPIGIEAVTHADHERGNPYLRQW